MFQTCTSDTDAVVDRFHCLPLFFRSALERFALSLSCCSFRSRFYYQVVFLSAWSLLVLASSLTWTTAPLLPLQ